MKANNAGICPLCNRDWIKGDDISTLNGQLVHQDCKNTRLKGGCC